MAHFEISLDLRKESRRQQVINTRVGDRESCIIICSVLENGKNADISQYNGRFRCLKPDHTFVEDDNVEIQENIITYAANSQVAAVPGMIGIAYFQLLDNDGNVIDSTEDFMIRVLSSGEENTCSGSSDYIDRVQKALSNFYTKEEIDQFIINLQKQIDEIESGSSIDAYTKEETDGLLATKASNDDLGALAESVSALDESSVKIQSDTMQVIDSNLSLALDKRLYGTDKNNSQHEIIGINEYVDSEGNTFEQCEVNSVGIHLNLNTNDDSNYGTHATVDTPEGKKVLAYTEDVPDITFPLSISNGGTAAQTAQQALKNLGGIDLHDGENIPDGSDILTVIEESGVYTCLTNDTAATLENAPFGGNSSFRIYVGDTNAGTGRARFAVAISSHTQPYIEVNATTDFNDRSLWTGWRPIGSSGDQEPVFIDYAKPPATYNPKIIFVDQDWNILDKTWGTYDNGGFPDQRAIDTSQRVEKIMSDGTREYVSFQPAASQGLILGVGTGTPQATVTLTIPSLNQIGANAESLQAALDALKVGIPDESNRSVTCFRMGLRPSVNDAYMWVEFPIVIEQV